MKPARAQAMLPAFSDVPVFRVDGPVLGIDPSLTGSALCLVRPGEPLIEERYSTDATDTINGGVARHVELAQPIVRIVERYAVRVAFIEGPIFGKTDGKAIERAGYRWVLYHALVRRGVLIAEVNTTWLKLFAADSGSAQKTDVKSGLELRYGHPPFGKSKASEDTADAFGLAMLGWTVTGRIPCETAGQRHAVMQVVTKLRKEVA